MYIYIHYSLCVSLCELRLYVLIKYVCGYQHLSSENECNAPLSMSIYGKGAISNDNIIIILSLLLSDWETVTPGGGDSAN